MRGVLFFSAACLAMAASPAQAIYFHTGNDAWDSCESRANSGGGGYCLGYVAGLNDQADVTFARNCAPAGVTLRQLTDVFVKYLREHPEQRHELASKLFNTAMDEAFPCQSP